MRPRIVLAYSGSLTATFAIPWLTESQGADVVAVTLDLGQQDNLVEARARALAAGAIRCHVFDARDAFARRHILPALKANALADGVYPLSTALGRPLIAEKLVEAARLEQAAAVAHGGSGRDRSRIEGLVRGLDTGLGVIAVADGWDFSAEQLADFADRHRLPGATDLPGSTRVDRNLWGRSIVCPSGDAWTEPAEDLHILTRAIERTPSDPALVDITFEQGSPVQINGVAMPIVELIESLATIAGEHGVGRLDHVTQTAEGSCREVHEAPAAVVLHLAHADLASFVAAGRLTRVTADVSRAYCDVVDNGEWHSPLRHALDGFVDRVAERVTGVVRLRLFKGACRVVGRSSSPGAAAARETTA